MACSIVSIGVSSIFCGVGTPKGESDPSPEEKLLKAIFGDKAGDVKDASLKANPSLSGTVIKTALYAKVSKDSGKRGAKSEQKTRLEIKQQEAEAALAKLRAGFIDKLWSLVNGKKSAGVSDLYGVEIFPKGKEFTLQGLKDADYQNISTAKWVSDAKISAMVRSLISGYCIAHKEAETRYKRELDKIKVGDELPNGVMQIAKVYVYRLRIQPWC